MATKAMGKLKRTLGGAKGATPMVVVESATPKDSARPGAWKTMLLPAPTEAKANKARHVPVAIDEQILKDVADGGQASEIEAKYQVRAGYVRSVLLRRFGSVEGMKKALRAQCLENAILLNEYAIERKEQIHPSQALLGSKVMIDGAVALEKTMTDRPTTVDFAALSALGGVLSKIEKRIAQG
jgi:hypothetical protein